MIMSVCLPAGAEAAIDVDAVLNVTLILPCCYSTSWPAAGTTELM